jgi:hypothetical protein
MFWGSCDISRCLRRLALQNRVCLVVQFEKRWRETWKPWCGHRYFDSALARGNLTVCNCLSPLVTVKMENPLFRWYTLSYDLDSLPFEKKDGVVRGRLDISIRDPVGAVVAMLASFEGSGTMTGR